MKISFFFLLLVSAILGGCEKYNPVNPKNQGNPAYGTGDYDYYDYYDATPTPCTLNYTIYNNDPYNYTLYWPGGGTTYVPSYGIAYYSLTYAGCASVAFYDGSYDEGDLSFCPCSDNYYYTIDKY